LVNTRVVADEGRRLANLAASALLRSEHADEQAAATADQYRDLEEYGPGDIRRAAEVDGADYHRRFQIRAADEPLDWSPQDAPGELVREVAARFAFRIAYRISADARDHRGVVGADFKALEDLAQVREAFWEPQNRDRGLTGPLYGTAGRDTSQTINHDQAVVKVDVFPPRRIVDGASIVVWEMLVVSVLRREPERPVSSWA
jgi:hypothetical protein